MNVVAKQFIKGAEEQILAYAPDIQAALWNEIKVLCEALLKNVDDKIKTPEDPKCM